MRVDALRAEADPSFDRMARIVREALGVPVALVSVVEPQRQIFPGAVGLPEPWQCDRQTPLSHSFCQYVVADGAPLVISDARLDPRLADNLAIPDLGVVAYAGFPLRSVDGTVIGSVCAIDDRPRAWTPAELSVLADLAEVTSVELALRESRDQLEIALGTATDMSQRARLMLRMSQALGGTTTAAHVAQTLYDLATEHLGCTDVELWLTDSREQPRLVRVPCGGFADPSVDRPRSVAADSSDPLGAVYSHRVPATDPRTGASILPLVTAGEVFGVLAVTWTEHGSLGADVVTTAALATYTAQAVQRATLLDERADVAHTLQAALLDHRLPQPDGLHLSARYLAVARQIEIGGDWYDCLLAPNGYTHVVVGDVQGHDAGAAAVMGSLRNILRTLAWAIDDTPAATVRRLDQAARDLGVRRAASLVLGRIEQSPEQAAQGLHTFRWTSAGHLPPVLLRPDGTCVVLDDDQPNDCILSVVPDAVRRDRIAVIPAGSTLLLYTDGLVEARASDLDVGIDALRAAVTRHRDADPDALLDLVLADVVGTHRVDDIAVLAVRFDRR